MLTMPADKKLREPSRYNSRLALYKESFVNRDMVSILMALVSIPISHTGMERTHQDIQLIELVLTLFRNLLAIKAAKANITDELYAVLEREHLFMLIIHLVSEAEAPENARFNLLLLEIIALILARQDPSIIAAAPDFTLEPAIPVAPHNQGENISKPFAMAPLAISSSTLGASSPSGTQSPTSASASQGTRPSLQSNMSSKGAALAAALEASSAKSKGKSSPQTTVPRHSRFGGFIVSSPVVTSNVKLSSLVEKPKDAEEADAEKDESKKPNARNRAKKPLKNTEWTENPSKTSSSLVSIIDVLSPKLQQLRKSKVAAGATVKHISGSDSAANSAGSLVTKSILKRFARSVLDYGYNALLRVISTLVNDHSPNIMDTDLDNYVWAVGFFPAFVSAEFRRQPAGERTFDAGSFQSVFEEATFYYLLEQLERYETEKNVAKVEVHFLAFKNLLFTLLALYESGLPAEMQISESIVMQLIYNPELLVDRLPRLVRTFTNLRKGAHLLLPHLVEGVHLFLSVLERISDDGTRKLVQLKKRAKDTMGGKGLMGEDDEGSYKKSLLDELDDDGIVPDSLPDADKDADSYNPTQSQDGGDGDLVDGEKRGSPSKKQVRSDSDANGDTPDAKADDKEDEFVEREKRLREQLQMLQEEEDDEDAARDERYFDVQDYIKFYSKQSIILAIMELLRMYDVNLERTNEAALGMLKRLRAVGGLPMLFQISHLRVLASMLTGTSETALSPAARELRTFARETTAVFLQRFSEDPVTFGLTALWSKKISYAKELDEGLYLTYNSAFDGTLEEYERRREGTGFKEPDAEIEAMHKSNPSRLNSSYNQRARPYLGEGLEGNSDFDLGALLSEPSKASKPPKQKLSREQQIEAKWKELMSSTERKWTAAEEKQLDSLYVSFSTLGEADLTPMLLSMMDMESPMTAVDIYVKLSQTVDAAEFAKITRPELEAVHLANIAKAPEPRSKPSAPVPKKKAVVAEEEDAEGDGDVTFSMPARAFSEEDRLTDSEGNEDDGQPRVGKTAKQLADEMRKKKLEQLALEKRRREERAVEVEKMREERAEQRKEKEAATAEAREERTREKAAAKEEKEKLKLAEKERKEAERREKRETKERVRGESKAGRGVQGKRVARKPASEDFDLDAPNRDENDAAGSDDENTEDLLPKRVIRPKRTAVRRKTTSDFDRFLEGLDSSSEEKAPSTSESEDEQTSELPNEDGETAATTTEKRKSKKNDDGEFNPSALSDNDDEAVEKTSKKRTKRKRAQDDDDEDFENAENETPKPVRRAKSTGGNKKSKRPEDDDDTATAKKTHKSKLAKSKKVQEAEEDEAPQDDEPAKPKRRLIKEAIRVESDDDVMDMSE